MFTSFINRLESEKIIGWYERRVAPFAFVTGFLLDFFTLTRIDLYRDNLILFSYLTVALVSILAINLYDGGRLQYRFVTYIRPWLPVFMQFSFGGLFSGFMIFYWRSASFISSWVFLGFLAFFLVGNESFRHRYARLNFQVSILFIALFSYMIFFVPIISGRMSGWVFLLSGLVSLVAIGVVLAALSAVIPERAREERTFIVGIIAAIFFAINLLYFFNLIPPIPLSLKEVGVYHSLTRTADGQYRVQDEEGPWYAFFKSYKIVHVQSGNPLYVYSAVFAPTNITTTIVHNWQYFDELGDTWQRASRIPFPVFGGRDGGYRGYSVKTNLKAGKWRVDVETPRGQILGRIKFMVEETPEILQLEEKVL